MGFWILGTGLGLLFYRKGTVFKRPAFYAAGLLAFVIWAPNIWWQWSNGWPVLGHLGELQASHLSEQTYQGFILDQLILPATLVTSLVGLWWLSRKAEYRWIAISVGCIFLLMLFLRAKSYYVYPIYPVLFAAGGVFFERWLRRHRPVWAYLLAASILLPFLYFIPHLTPVLPIDQYIAYLGQEAEDVELTSDYADMFGWPEQVALVDSIYQSLSAEEQANCTIWAENYGEAGAIQLLGKNYGLPAPISRHGSFWTWGYGNPDPLVWISVGNELPVLESVFQNIQIVRYIDHPFAVAEERGIPVAIGRGLKVDLPSWWASYEEHIFD
ncbi:MAG: hypothetical protein AAFU60_03215 [Bacteroidota bacterium]